MNISNCSFRPVTSINLKNQYKDRYIRYLGFSKIRDWYVKLYTISIDDKKIDRLVINAATDLALVVLRGGNCGFNIYNVAFVILHRAQEGYFLLIGRWVDENMLMQDVYLSDFASPLEFNSIHNTHIVACVWELEIIYAERNSWVENVMKSDSSDCLLDYLSCHAGCAA